LSSDKRPYQLNLWEAQELVSELILTTEEITGAYTPPSQRAKPAPAGTVKVSAQRVIKVSDGERYRVRLDHAPVLQITPAQAEVLVETITARIEAIESRAEARGTDPYP
jgi:hypothetical protein